MGNETLTLTRAEVVEAFDYLDVLRTTGVTNMYGAGEYLQGAFVWDKAAARKLLTLWMQTFDGERPVEERVTAAIGDAS